MLLNNILPSKHLQSYIRFYRIIDFDFSKDSVPQTKAYRPRIEHCLQFTPFDLEKVDYQHQKNISYKSALFGQQTVLSHRKLGRRFLNFQIIFQSGVLYQMLKIPIDELTNSYYDSELFFGSQINDVNEQLANADSYEKMIFLIECFLWRFLKNNEGKQHSVNNIAKLLFLPEYNKLEWFAEKSNLSYRQFDRVFKTNTGITPKEYKLLVKLDDAYLIKNRNPHKDWLTIALESGFYDYQHLSKNYKKFLGFSPTEFYKIEQNAPERFFGDYEQ